MRAEQAAIGGSTEEAVALNAGGFATSGASTADIAWAQVEHASRSWLPPDLRELDKLGTDAKPKRAAREKQGKSKKAFSITGVGQRGKGASQQALRTTLEQALGIPSAPSWWVPAASAADQGVQTPSAKVEVSSTAHAANAADQAVPPMSAKVGEKAADQAVQPTSAKVAGSSAAHAAKAADQAVPPTSAKVGASSASPTVNAADQAVQPTSAKVAGSSAAHAVNAADQAVPPTSAKVGASSASPTANAADQAVQPTSAKVGVSSAAHAVSAADQAVPPTSAKVGASSASPTAKAADQAVQTTSAKVGASFAARAINPTDQAVPPTSAKKDASSASPTAKAADQAVQTTSAKVGASSAAHAVSAAADQAVPPTSAKVGASSASPTADAACQALQPTSAKVGASSAAPFWTGVVRRRCLTASRRAEDKGGVSERGGGEGPHRELPAPRRAASVPRLRSGPPRLQSGVIFSLPTVSNLSDAHLSRILSEVSDVAEFRRFAGRSILDFKVAGTKSVHLSEPFKALQPLVATMAALAKSSLREGEDLAIIQLIVNHFKDGGDVVKPHRHRCRQICASLGAARELEVDGRKDVMVHGDALLLSGEIHSVPVARRASSTRVSVCLFYGSTEEYENESISVNATDGWFGESFWWTHPEDL